MQQESGCNCGSALQGPISIIVGMTLSKAYLIFMDGLWVWLSIADLPKRSVGYSSVAVKQTTAFLYSYFEDGIVVIGL